MGAGLDKDAGAFVECTTGGADVVDEENVLVLYQVGFGALKRAFHVALTVALFEAGLSGCGADAGDGAGLAGGAEKTGEVIGQKGGLVETAFALADFVKGNGDDDLGRGAFGGLVGASHGQSQQVRVFDAVVVFEFFDEELGCGFKGGGGAYALEPDGAFGAVAAFAFAGQVGVGVSAGGADGLGERGDGVEAGFADEPLGLMNALAAVAAKPGQQEIDKGFPGCPDDAC